jgi:hypothetical protein
LNLFPSNAIPMPIRDEIACDESGPGYALRMAGENNLSFSDIVVEVGTDSRNYLPHHASRSLAFWFGGNSVQLCASIPRTFKIDGMVAAEFMWHEFRRPYHLRQCSPQICPSCLWKYRRAFSWWDIGLATVCPEHQVRLIDVCSTCGRNVSWRRPGMLFCRCGASFHVEAKARDKATKDELWLSSKIRNLLCPRVAAGIDDFDPRISFLAGLSLDCLLRLIWAFGILPNDGIQVSPGKLSRVLRTNDAVVIVGRAFGRLRCILSDLPVTKETHGIHEVALRSLLDDCRSCREYALIRNILNRVVASRQTGIGKKLKTIPNQWQFDLF